MEKINERFLRQVSKMDEEMNARFKKMEDYLRGIVGIHAHNANIKEQRIADLKQKLELMNLQLGSVNRKLGRLRGFSDRNSKEYLAAEQMVRTSVPSLESSSVL